MKYDEECQEDFDIVDVVNCLPGLIRLSLLGNIFFGWKDGQRLFIHGLVKQRGDVHCGCAGDLPDHVAPSHRHALPCPLKHEVGDETQECDEQHHDVVDRFSLAGSNIWCNGGVEIGGIKPPEQDRRDDV